MQCLLSPASFTCTTIGFLPYWEQYRLTVFRMEHNVRLDAHSNAKGLSITKVYMPTSFYPRCRFGHRAYKCPDDNDIVLMVYNAGEDEIREALKSKKETVLNQVGKANSKSTMRWLFQRMNGINPVTLPGQKACITGLTEEKNKLLRLFGPEIARLYNLT
jgi:hypothetical protein